MSMTVAVLLAAAVASSAPVAEEDNSPCTPHTLPKTLPLGDGPDSATPLPAPRRPGNASAAAAPEVGQPEQVLSALFADVSPEHLFERRAADGLEDIALELEEGASLPEQDLCAPLNLTLSFLEGALVSDEEVSAADMSVIDVEGPLDAGGGDSATGPGEPQSLHRVSTPSRSGAVTQPLGDLLPTLSAQAERTVPLSPHIAAVTLSAANKASMPPEPPAPPTRSVDDLIMHQAAEMRWSSWSTIHERLSKRSSAANSDAGKVLPEASDEEPLTTDWLRSRMNQLLPGKPRPHSPSSSCSTAPSTQTFSELTSVHAFQAKLAALPHRPGQPHPPPVCQEDEEIALESASLAHSSPRREQEVVPRSSAFSSACYSYGNAIARSPSHASLSVVSSGPGGASTPKGLLSRGAGSALSGGRTAFSWPDAYTDCCGRSEISSVFASMSLPPPPSFDPPVLRQQAV
eukprot:gnl/TRDRNA2_/TRDRNA2_161900_c1_seq1.p1 gnl/TRDRNA2_/TRDRNA2_161900_c1~~gnl/TRDRNA2_/TRDRNA2_161900_c1_seq1.p1  ORF type:complete len:492 (+),score=78.42 gnl/TRDRNA2_/TRDRNA2_161900_c1_seq1:98-1477(+)